MNRIALKSIAKKCNSNCFFRIFFLPIIIQFVIMAPIIISAFFAMPIITLVVALVSLLLMEAPALVVINNYCLINLKGQPRDFASIFAPIVGAKKYFSIICVAMLKILIISLGFVCLIIPGFIAIYALSMTDYIMCEKKKFGIIETIKLSFDMTKGHKTELFVKDLSFLGWNFLVLITFGIAGLWVQPYIQLTSACYYEALKYSDLGRSTLFGDFLFNADNYPKKGDCEYQNYANANIDRTRNNSCDNNNGFDTAPLQSNNDEFDPFDNAPVATSNNDD
ncbi:MAG: DUF975 family protein, partial [Clostridia bacterium]